MFAKKALSTGRQTPSTYRKELDYLYARRSAVDSLIRSLEEYDRFRALQQDTNKRKTA